MCARLTLFLFWWFAMNHAYCYVSLVHLLGCDARVTARNRMRCSWHVLILLRKWIIHLNDNLNVSDTALSWSIKVLRVGKSYSIPVRYTATPHTSRCEYRLRKNKVNSRERMTTGSKLLRGEASVCTVKVTGSNVKRLVSTTKWSCKTCVPWGRVKAESFTKHQMEQI